VTPIIGHPEKRWKRAPWTSPPPEQRWPGPCLLQALPSQLQESHPNKSALKGILFFHTSHLTPHHMTLQRRETDTNLASSLVFPTGTTNP
jgi:hypothetical protein